MQKCDTLPDTRPIDFLLWLLRLRKRFRVNGPSMEPLFETGDEVLINPRAYRRKKPLPNELVVAQHPIQPEMKLIKRVVSVDKYGACFLVGDNPLYSTDSTTWGLVPFDHILGKVTNRFR